MINQIGFDINKQLKKGEEILWVGKPMSFAIIVQFIFLLLIGIGIPMLFTSMFGLDYMPFSVFVFIFILILYFVNREPKDHHRNTDYIITTNSVLIYKNGKSQKILLKNILDVRINKNNIENNSQLDFWYLNKRSQRTKVSFYNLNNVHEVYHILLDQLLIKGKNVVLLKHFKTFSKKNKFEFSTFSQERKQCIISGIKDGVKVNITIDGLFPIDKINMEFETLSPLSFAFSIKTKKIGPPFILYTDEHTTEQDEVNNKYQIQWNNENKFKSIFDPKNQKGLLKHIKQFEQVKIDFGILSSDFQKEKSRKYFAIKDKEEVLDLHLIKRAAFVEEERIIVNENKNTTLNFSGKLSKNAYKKPFHIAKQLELSFKAMMDLAQTIKAHEMKDSKIFNS